jgi:hypothetical protein
MFLTILKTIVIKCLEFLLSLQFVDRPLTLALATLLLHPDSAIYTPLRQDELAAGYIPVHSLVDETPWLGRVGCGLHPCS